MVLQKNLRSCQNIPSSLNQIFREDIPTNIKTIIVSKPHESATDLSDFIIAFGEVVHTSFFALKDKTPRVSSFKNQTNNDKYFSDDDNDVEELIEDCQEILLVEDKAQSKSKRNILGRKLAASSLNGRKTLVLEQKTGTITTVSIYRS